MASYFEEINNKKSEEIEEEPKKNIFNNKEEKTTDAVDEDKNKENDMEQNMKEAFAKIVSVEIMDKADDD